MIYKWHLVHATVQTLHAHSLFRTARPLHANQLPALILALQLAQVHRTLGRGKLSLDALCSNLQQGA